MIHGQKKIKNRFLVKAGYFSPTCLEWYKGLLKR